MKDLTDKMFHKYLPPTFKNRGAEPNRLSQTPWREDRGRFSRSVRRSNRRVGTGKRKQARICKENTCRSDRGRRPYKITVTTTKKATHKHPQHHGFGKTKECSFSYSLCVHSFLLNPFGTWFLISYIIFCLCPLPGGIYIFLRKVQPMPNHLLP